MKILTVLLFCFLASGCAVSTIRASIDQDEDERKPLGVVHSGEEGLKRFLELRTHEIWRTHNVNLSDLPQLDKFPELLSDTRPDCLDEGIEFPESVSVEILIAKDGTVEYVHSVKTDSLEVRKCINELVRSFIFSPAIFQAEPVRFFTTVNIPFQKNEESEIE